MATYAVRDGAVDGGSYTVLMPDGSNTTSKDTIIVMLVSRRLGGEGYPNTWPGGWTQRYREAISNGSTDQWLEVYSRVPDGTEGWDGTDDSITVTPEFSGGGVAQVWRLDGVTTWTDIQFEWAAGSDAGGAYTVDLGTHTPATPGGDRRYFFAIGGSADMDATGWSATLTDDRSLTQNGYGSVWRSSVQDNAASLTPADPTGTSLQAPQWYVARFHIQDPDIAFTPDAFGAEGGFQADVAFALGADVALRVAQAFGAEAGFQTGLRFATPGPRQVMLTGSGIETPEMTEGGAEGEVLTYHPDAKPTWEERGLTAAEVAALLSPDWYTCDSLTATKGTVDAGAHTDLHATGGTTVAISEVTGTPGISITLAFSTVDALTAWEVRGYYAGSASHEVDIQLWNYDTSAWDTVGVMPSEAAQHVYSGVLADGTPYFDAGTGAAQMRLYHPDPGNASHDLFLDYVVIGHTTSGGGALALDDLSDVDAAAPADGDVLTWDDGTSSWVAAAPVAGDAGTLHVDLDVSGAHEIDLADGATHDLTLTGDATFTLAGVTAGVANDLRLVLRQDGTGGWTVTWPGSVEWEGGSAPILQTDPDAVDVIGLVTVDDGTTWLGFHASGGGTPATTVEAETSFGLSSAVGSDTAYARQGHTHGTPANPVTEAAIRDIGHWEVVVSGSAPPVAVTNEAEDDWVYGWVGG